MLIRLNPEVLFQAINLFLIFIKQIENKQKNLRETIFLLYNGLSYHQIAKYNMHLAIVKYLLEKII